MSEMKSMRQSSVAIGRRSRRARQSFSKGKTLKPAFCDREAIYTSLTAQIGIAWFAAIFLFLCLPGQTWAHCDSLEGPVVKDAKAALESGDVTPVLKWIKEGQEREIRDVFEQTVRVRAKGKDAQDLVDRYFFETLVRIHRAGEGEAYTGLKPATSVDPGIEAADEALKSGSVGEVADHLSAAIGEGIRKRFALVQERRKHAEDSVEAGREYVQAYVDYIHYVESVHRLTSHGAPHLHRESREVDQ